MALPYFRGSSSRQAVQSISTALLSSHFSTSISAQAAVKKKGAKPVQQKRKTPIRKSTASGPRSTKQRASGGGDVNSSVSRDNPFLEPPRRMKQLEELVPENATASKLHQGLAWTKRTLEATRIQGFGLTRELARQFTSTPRPRTVLRQASLDLFDILDRSSASSSSSPNLLLRGFTGSGISTLLLQCFSYALESSWIVIYVPRAINLVDSSSPYEFNEKLHTYLQPAIARNLLEKIATINQSSLEQLTVSGELSIEGEKTVDAGTKLSQLAQLGLDRTATPAMTQEVLEAVLKEIVQQRQVPVLMAIDGAQALFSTSSYRDPDYRQLQSYELAVPRLLQACLRKSGHGSFGGVQRGKLMAAFSLQHKEWAVPLEMKTVLQDRDVDRYAKLDETMLNIVQDCQFGTLDIAPALTLAEASSVVSLMRDEGMAWSTPNDEFLLSKLVESGGLLGTFDRSLRSSPM